VSILGDCARGTPHVPFATTQNGAGTTPALPVHVSDTVSPADGQAVGVWAGHDPASAARLDSHLAALCSRAR
jgi:hypothetical protein